MRHVITAILGAILLMACTTINVKKVDSSKYPLKLVCIEENPQVLVDDLLAVLEGAFQSRNIRTVIYKGKAPDRCEYTLWYTAYRGWDLKPFVKRVELRLRQGDETIATATYNHSGGLALNKWESTERKLTPVLDELLADFGPQSK
jgi:hypothetical protein